MSRARAEAASSSRTAVTVAAEAPGGRRAKRETWSLPAPPLPPPALGHVLVVEAPDQCYARHQHRCRKCGALRHVRRRARNPARRPRRREGEGRSRRPLEPNHPLCLVPRKHDAAGHRADRRAGASMAPSRPRAGTARRRPNPWPGVSLQRQSRSVPSASCQRWSP